MDAADDDDRAAMFAGLLDPPPAWNERAACRGLDPRMFYAERGEPTEPAMRVCRGCVVRTNCLEFALTNCEKFGIWGGQSERSRRQERARRRQSAA